MEREEVDILIKECCDPEDDDGFIPYERELSNVSQEPFNKRNIHFDPFTYFGIFPELSNILENFFKLLCSKSSIFSAFLRRVCAGPHPELYEDW